MDLILRMGAHSEKEYFMKLTNTYEGAIIGANLLEATPGASSSFLLKLKGLGKSIYVDPVTHAFSIDFSYLRVEKIDKKTKKKRCETKKSFASLAVAYGEPFSGAIEQRRSVSPDEFKGSVLSRACGAVASYQMQRMRREFESDPELREFADRAPTPSAVIAPYLFVPSGSSSLPTLKANLNLIEGTSSAVKGTPVHAVICADQSILSNDRIHAEYAACVKSSRISAVWLWYSALNEASASLEILNLLRKRVQELSRVTRVTNMHGGYFSLCLSKCGLDSISHSVGYGESRDVLPVMGASAPSVRYHLPPLHRRFGVPDIQRTFRGLGIGSPSEFFGRICDCVVCRGVIAEDLTNFRQFGETYRPRPDAKRDVQTPASAKRARYHFLLARLKERDRVGKATLAELDKRLVAEGAMFRDEDAIASRDKDHIEKWRLALSGREG